MPSGAQPEKEVSPKQLQVFLLIVGHIEQWGYQPTMEELAKILGIDRRSVHDRMRLLERKGWLELGKNRDRAVILRGVNFRAVFTPERQNAIERRPVS
ncbi:MAG: LexA family protein [Gemmataceae bacterium]